jgi:hypothetical protein
MASDVRGRLKILAVLTIVLSGGWAAAGLAFRYTAYNSMPVAPGEPYGEADVLELVHYGVLLILSGLVALQGLVLLIFGRFQLRPLAAFLCLFGLALPFAYRPLHSWVADLAVGYRCAPNKALQLTALSASQPIHSGPTMARATRPLAALRSGRS